MAERAGISLESVLRVARGTIVIAAAALLASSLVQCSADDGGAGSGGGANAGGAGGSSANGGTGAIGFDGNISPDVQTKDYSAEDFFIEDPPPQGCDGGGQPVVPGGTPECPADKNLPGCPCTEEGKKAPCWPGLRKHRNRGNCKDGETTCGKVGEVQLVWGPCQGYQGIDPNTFMPLGATGKAACTCFSGGYWQIDNLSPCFISQSQGGPVLGAISTVMPGNCPPNAGSIDWNNPPVPADPWSTNTVTSDCTGYFKLCFTLKALSSPNAPQSASDCTMKQVCTEQYYSVANQPQSFPNLPGWVTQAPAEKSCAQAFVTNGGYAEMSVVGESDECDKVNKVFQTITYCPLKCADPANANDPECVNCQNGGGGPF